MIAFPAPVKGAAALIQTRCPARGGLRRVAAGGGTASMPAPVRACRRIVFFLKNNVTHYNSKEKQAEVFANIIEIF